ncbi:Sigma70_r3 domain-containing protein/Sigma70_r2 domain-containing protein/Sigma70_r4 domain-containing protein [Cephalotus follicularis]|uniref:Sigma70_r3 domain-containing protein/Sigma70_r2 domain-containing protein/Sigma70_r4 domain-containing protein n=1 Tax=Cephalotus follicularis TaxID=3775 RepID=A0A1Q3C1L1_CEPFO|nr:Sigma70_r3 domain-containing protein/Sigma70_r2 domain-containing protein/Sigma70_r4 domain-containing protein [Cephalotus follicularis]
MMATAAVIGLSAGKRLLSSSFCNFDLTEKFLCVNNDHGLAQSQIASAKNVIVAKKASDYSPSFPSSNRPMHSVEAFKEHVDTASVELWYQISNDMEEESSDLDYSVEALLLLQKSMLEKQWNLTFEGTMSVDSPSKKVHKKIPVTCSGVSARQRRMNNNKRKNVWQTITLQPGTSKQHSSIISPELLQHRMKGYRKGTVSEQLLTHTEVVRLSRIIRAGLSLEEHKSRLKERLGCEPTDEQISTSLRISRAELQAKVIECSLAKEKLAMSNVRLVMSIANRYDNMGAEMADLVQGGLIGLLRGIEKFDSSKGFKISTYVYWWIRQGVSRALVENSRTLRLPNHLHERLSLVKNAKMRLEEKGITPSIDRIAESLNMTQKKVRNATEAISKVFSLDREAFPSLNGLPQETHHSYIADNCLENIPWHGVDEWALKNEVNKLINTTLGERERDIIRLYYGLGEECLTWEDISKRIGLSRERVRQVGLVALEKLKHAARRRKMEALLVKH